MKESSTSVKTAPASSLGSALIIALLVAFVLSLLGISFLMMSQIETKIADSEVRATQALFVAEAGARVVQEWFDRPGSAIGFPTDLSLVDRTQRRIVDEANPHGPTLGATPTYKDGFELDLFQRPYRGSLEHALMGTSDGPDMVIDEDGSSTEAAFLDQLSQTILGSFLDGTSNIRARIARIDVFAPPYVSDGSRWNRYGIGTVRVTARIYRIDPIQQVLSESTVSLVLGEIPYGVTFGPLHSCTDLSFSDALSAAWGTVTADGTVSYSNNPDDVPNSLPRSVPPVARLEALWAATASELSDFQDAFSGQDIDDPWLRMISSRGIYGEPVVNQPYLPASILSCCDNSNVIQHHPSAACPTYDYNLWKSIALSGQRGARYYSHVDTDRFKEDGVGPTLRFKDITSESTGLLFFDTTDGRPPRDDNDDGTYDNLTPAITVSGSWYTRGFIYLNSADLQLNNITCNPTDCGVTFSAPGEPFLDIDGDGQFNYSTDEWVNLRYATTLNDVPVLDPTDTMGGGLTRNDRGPAIASSASLHGILHTNGALGLSGSGKYYGSIIANTIRIEDTPVVLWDASIGVDWPPDHWQIPRVFRLSWRNNS